MDARRFTVLLVEDSPSDSRLIREVLDGSKWVHFEVQCSDTLAKALVCLERANFDAVLLDLCLPDSQGLETFLQVSARVPSVPIVVLSGIEDESLALKAVQQGAQDYLPKSAVDPNADTSLLERSLRYAIERKHAEELLRAEDRMLRRLLDLHERERKLFAYEIHDGLLQYVIAAQMEIASLRDRLATRSGIGLQKLFSAARSLGQAIQEGRRLISDLRPLIIDEEGILAAIEYLVGEEEAHDGLAITFRHDVKFQRLPPLLEGTIFRILQEAISNVKRHSHASQMEVRLTQVADRLCIEVRDEGIGFDPLKVSDERFGLRGIRERVRLLDGHVAIDSAPGRGTRILVDLPLSVAASLAEDDRPAAAAEIPRKDMTDAGGVGGAFI
jgi:signal transduction histidine kinase